MTAACEMSPPWTTRWPTTAMVAMSATAPHAGPAGPWSRRRASAARAGREKGSVHLMHEIARVHLMHEIYALCILTADDRGLGRGRKMGRVKAAAQTGQKRTAQRVRRRGAANAGGRTPWPAGSARRRRTSWNASPWSRIGFAVRDCRRRARQRDEGKPGGRGAKEGGSDGKGRGETAAAWLRQLRSESAGAKSRGRALRGTMSCERALMGGLSCSVRENRLGLSPDVPIWSTAPVRHQLPMRLKIENESIRRRILFVIYYLTPRMWHLSAAIQYQLAYLKSRRDQT